MGAVKVIAWASWIILTGSILLEITARLRHLPSPRIPGLSVPQGAARRLVTAALLLFVISPASATIASAAPASPASAATPAAVSTTVDRAPITSPAPTAATKPTYTVRPGDTLTGIAERELGDSERWHDIADLNPAVARHPDLIHVGTVLVMPCLLYTSRRHLAAARLRHHAYAGDREAGVASIQIVVLMPVLFLLMFIGMQAAIIYHGRTVAIAAAQEGARAAAAQNGTCLLYTSRCV